MTGMILWAQSGGILLEERRYLGTRFLCALVPRGHRTPPFLLRARLRQAGRKLRRRGVERAVLPQGIPEAGGLSPFPTAALRRALAAEWTAAVLPPSERAALKTGTLDRNVESTLRLLALRCRYVLLEAPDCEPLCRQLRRQCGASILQTADACRAGADFLVCFDPLEEEPPCPALRLLQDPLPPLPVPEPLPPEVDREQLFAAALEGGLREIHLGQFQTAVSGSPPSS